MSYILYYGFARWLPASYMPLGFVWRKVRKLICSSMFASCGKNINVESGAFFHSGRHIEIGDNSGIGVNAFLGGKITIGSDVMMGPDVVILTGTHRFDRLDIPMNRQGFKEEKPVAIGDDVWIGTRAIILPGVTIGRGSVVGAGAVVTKDVPACTVVAGNPARVIGMRT